MLAFCGFAVWRTLSIKQGFSSSIAGPSFVPWLMIGLISILSAILIFQGISAGKEGGKDSVIHFPDKQTLLTIAAFVVLLVLYAAAFFPIGYIPATLVTFVIGLWLIGERKIWLLIGFPVVMTFAVHFAFTNFLSIWLP
ncbi:MAG: C4-dicarboxylate ABC transporter permease [Robiginitomaculum sp.]|nr:MAG: C4-dicarboxylate ABC transporter permease [Robiginitomaculum sp.]